MQFERSPSATFLLDEQTTLTYRETGGRAGCVASALEECGITGGDRVLLMLPNSAVHVLVWLGLASAGATIVPIDYETPDGEIERILTRVKPALIVSTRSLAVAPPGRAQARVVNPADLLGGMSTPITEQPAPQDVLTLLSTSGTTSQPKLVMQTHSAFVLAAQAFPSWLGLTSVDRLMVVMPLFHLNAQLYSVLGSMAAGASVFIAPRFSANMFWDQTRKYGITEFNCVAPIPQILLRQPVRSDDRDNPVRVVYSAPAMPDEIQNQFEARFDVQVVTGYGMSESPFGMISPLNGGSPSGAMGRPRQHPELGDINEARVIDDDGRPVGPGTVGELLLKNPTLMLGYYDMPDETASALRDGWLHTGDLVYFDASRNYYFAGRKKDVIRSRGHNISPHEVEVVIAAHPFVAECAVLGMPSELGDVDVVAFVVLADSVSDHELRQWCSLQLAPYKVPTLFRVHSELPKTATGRVKKRELESLLQ